MADIKWVQNVEANQKELRNVRIHNVNGVPTTPVVGQVWYDTATGHLKYRSASSVNIDPLDRSFHTSTQTASTISDLATVVQAYRLDQFAAPNVDLSMGSHKITGLTAGTATGHAVEFDQLNAAIATANAGIVWKQPVRFATTANVATLAGGAPTPVDGVTVALNDRVLVKNQSTAAQNGIYKVTTVGSGANGTWVRDTDADTAAELQGGVVVSVDEGTAGNNTMWMLSADVVTLGTDAVTWTQFGAGSSYTASLGVQLVGADFRANLGAGLTLSGNQIVPDYTGTNVMKRKVAVGAVGTGSVDITVNHALALANQDDYICEVVEVSTHAKVLCGISSTDVNNIVLSFDTAPTSNQYRYQILGLS
jgi:hypothetical protein